MSPPPLPYLSPVTVGPPPTHSRGGTPSPKSQPLSLPDPPPVAGTCSLPQPCPHAAPQPAPLPAAMCPGPGSSGWPSPRCPAALGTRGPQGSWKGQDTSLLAPSLGTHRCQGSRDRARARQDGAPLPSPPGPWIPPPCAPQGGRSLIPGALPPPTLTQGGTAGGPQPTFPPPWRASPACSELLCALPCLRFRPKPRGAGGSERPPLRISTEVQQRACGHTAAPAPRQAGWARPATSQHLPVSL